MRVRWGTLAVLLLAGPLAAAATAGGTEVEGLAFRSKTLPGWRAGEQKDRSDGSVRTFHRDVTGAGEVTLEFSSHAQNDAEVAKTELALSRGLDTVEARTEVPGVEPRVVDARVPGAAEAYEVVAKGADATWRTLRARAGKYFVSVTLSAPAGAEEEAEEAWRVATASLRVEEPSLQVGTLVLWVLGFLVLVAVLVTLTKRRAPRTFAPPPPAPPAPPVARPLPLAAPLVTAAPPRVRGVGFSRADDGLPVFESHAKAQAAVRMDEMRPVGPRRATPAVPPRPPNLHPVKPVVRIVKGYDGGRSA